MVEHPITTIGNLLLLPQLEDQTVKDINQVLRSMIGLHIRAKPPDDQSGNLDPFSQAQQAAIDILGPGVYTEWMQGSEVKQDG
ncbi:hypothetical protein BSK49_01005 [Paenibacillus odorifer]|uniref:hypothetical protein n=1 Tax=Paenibacillus odorifer TaxID=189426 RepID=UPI00096D12A7|nr:hypothetical protein [Paenibacillus odorifer]OMD92994.1 hypothetical protein BSK49_01005 [Paenibacillus odorifer]